jgi:hypothetical protein
MGGERREADTYTRPGLFGYIQAASGIQAVIQKTEVRRQKTEVRRQKSEDRKQKKGI